MNAFVSTAVIAASAAPVLAINNPDHELLKLGDEYERLLDIEVPLKAESSRLWEEIDRRRYEIIGCKNPDDDDARKEAKNDVSWETWNNAWDEAEASTGYRAAYDAWNDMLRDRLNPVAEKIMQMPPHTLDGLLLRALVIENEEPVFELEPIEQLTKDLREFVERQRTSVAP